MIKKISFQMTKLKKKQNYKILNKIIKFMIIK